MNTIYKTVIISTIRNICYKIKELKNQEEEMTLVEKQTKSVLLIRELTKNEK